jgi:hypothetical protein
LLKLPTKCGSKKKTLQTYCFFSLKKLHTFYHACTPSKSRFNASNNSFSTTQLATTYKFCRRDGEKAAALISDASVNTIGNNKTFKKCAANYFSDDQTIIEKINNETYTYKNFHELVKENNSRNVPDK